LALFLPAAAFTDVLLSTTRGLRSMRPTVLLDRVMRPSAQLVLLSLVWALGWGPALFAALWALPYLPAALLAGFALGRLRRQVTGGPGGSDFTPRRFWGFTAPRAVASLAQMALQRVDVLLVAALAGLPPAAMYPV